VRSGLSTDLISKDQVLQAAFEILSAKQDLIRVPQSITRPAQLPYHLVTDSDFVRMEYCSKQNFAEYSLFFAGAFISSAVPFLQSFTVWRDSGKVGAVDLFCICITPALLLGFSLSRFFFDKQKETVTSILSEIRGRPTNNSE
jgi:hypothetical protein